MLQIFLVHKEVNHYIHQHHNISEMQTKVMKKTTKSYENKVLKELIKQERKKRINSFS